MAILVRDGTEKWKTLTPIPYSDEAQLQKMLYDSPELIPLQDDEAVAVFIREAGLPGSGSTDLIGVDSSGNILIIETKLAKNQEARRKVVGQILEYAAFLYGMSFDDFDDLFLRRRDKSLLALLVEQAPEFSSETVRETIRQNLSRGKFQLLIAVDQINNELEKIITYFAECGGGIGLEALELELYVNGKTQILVPKRHGPPEGTSPSAMRPRILSVQEVVERAEGVSRDRLASLVDVWLHLGNRIDPGTQGASFKADVNGRWQPIFWAYPVWLQPAFVDLSKKGAPSEAVQEFRRVVAGLKAFDRVKVMSGAQPMAKLAELSSEEIKEFVDASQKFVLEWRATAEGNALAAVTN